MTQAEKVAEKVVGAMIAQLEKGVIPWRKPWKTAGRGSMPHNFVSRKGYNGINLIVLAYSPYSCPKWGTYKQITEAGGHVRKGEHGTPVVFWKWLDIETTNQDGEDVSKKIPFLRYYTVFNLEQTEGLEKYWRPAALHDAAEYGPACLWYDTSSYSIDDAEGIWQGYQGRPELRHGGDRACYNPTTDLIMMPEQFRFNSLEEYYSTLFHEMVHSTGRAGRLGRLEEEKAAAWGGKEYSREELVAEIGASILANFCGFGELTLENSTAYCLGWLKVLKNDPKMLVIAGGRAHKAVNYITGTAEEKHAAEE